MRSHMVAKVILVQELLTHVWAYSIKAIEGPRLVIATDSVSYVSYSWIQSAIHLLLPDTYETTHFSSSSFLFSIEITHFSISVAIHLSVTVSPTRRLPSPRRPMPQSPPVPFYPFSVRR
ncbi:hypothetical protein P8452_10375 [Trifolium repens]|nr:hypothetical protein P8452_10375 [Trifolium repens]